MKNRYWLLMMVLLISIQIWGQFTTNPDAQPRTGYDEKEIMKKQAERYIARRDYEKGNTIYRELIQKYPDDWQIVEKLLTNLLRISKTEEVETLLNEKKDIFPEYNYLRIKIPLLIRQGETKEAEKLGDDYIDNNKTDIKSYQDLAQIFSGSRQYEKAAEILENSRKMTKDDYLYTLDLARAYQSAEKNKPAIIEYLKHLERNKHYLHYVMNNLKGMLNRDQKLISAIADFEKNSESMEVKEVYALCLAHIKNFEQALDVYADLETIKLLNFAEEMYKSHQDAVALLAYQQYMDREKEPHLQAEAQIMRAQIYMRQKDYAKAESELMSVYNRKELHKGNYRYRSQVSQQSRLLLADLSIRLDRPAKVVTKYLDEAAEFAINDKSRKEIGFAAVDYRIKSGELDAAAEQLQKLLKGEESGTDIFKLSSYYTWQIALMQKAPLADSLLGELIINLPDNELTTEALYLTQVQTSLGEEYQPRLFEAWRLRGLYKNEDARLVLQEIYDATGNDEIQLLLAEWADNVEDALFWWQDEYESDILGEYARLQILENATSDSLKVEMITDFLKENPQSIFAPVFRKHLQEAEAGRFTNEK